MFCENRKEYIEMKKNINSIVVGARHCIYTFDTEPTGSHDASSFPCSSLLFASLNNSAIERLAGVCSTDAVAR